MTHFRTKHVLWALTFGTLLCIPAAHAQVQKVGPPVQVQPLPKPLSQKKVLSVTLFWQETPMWCWAASGEMLMDYLGPRNVPQCYEANELFGRTDCCSCPTPAECVHGGWPQFDTWGYNSTTTSWGTPLSWPEVMGQINHNDPFMFSWAWNGGGAHAMVAKGYSYFAVVIFPIRTWVWVDNPWPPAGRCGPGGNASGPFGGDTETVTYAEFVGGSGYDHTHGADIYNISYR